MTLIVCVHFTLISGLVYYFPSVMLIRPIMQHSIFRPSAFISFISIFSLLLQENEFNAEDDLYNDVITAPSSGDNSEAVVSPKSVLLSE